MKRLQRVIGKERQRADLGLTDKPVYRDQGLPDGIDGEEKTFERDGAEQGWTLGRNKAWSRGFIAVQSQPRFGDGPNVFAIEILRMRSAPALRFVEGTGLGSKRRSHDKKLSSEG